MQQIQKSSRATNICKADLRIQCVRQGGNAVVSLQKPIMNGQLDRNTGVNGPEFTLMKELKSKETKIGVICDLKLLIMNSMKKK